MTMRERKRRHHARFRVLTRHLQPFGPGLTFWPGVYVVHYDDQGPVRQGRRFW